MALIVFHYNDRVRRAWGKGGRSCTVSGSGSSNSIWRTAVTEVVDVAVVPRKGIAAPRTPPRHTRQIDDPAHFFRPRRRRCHHI